MLEPFRNPLALLRFYGVCLVGLTIDLFTKSLAEKNLSDGTRIQFIPGYLHFEWVVNLGAVFGIGAGKRWLFVAVSMLALAFLTWLFSASKRQWGYQIILGMLLAGVLGNLYDRIMFGHVRDMIRALPGWEWPGTWHILGYPSYDRQVFPYVFNIADVLLCTGVSLMLLHAAFFDWLFKSKETPTTSVPDAPVA